MTHRPLAAVLAAALALAPAAGVGAEPADPPERFETVGALLDALETADEGLRTFRSKIVYDRRFALQDDQHIRFGDLYYTVEAPASAGAPPTRSFEVAFDTLLLKGAGPDDPWSQREERESWIFDGRWLVEKRYEERQYVAREIARPGQTIDPLALGESPLPIPIGQRKADILDRYEAELLEPLEDLDAEDPTIAGYREHAAGAHQVRLVPLPHVAEDAGFREARLWYRRDAGGRLLPVLARTIDRKRDESYFQIAEPIINEPLPAGALDTTPPVGWHVQTERGRFADDAPAPEATDDRPEPGEDP
jgi:hypothetical protein